MLHYNYRRYYCKVIH